VRQVRSFLLVACAVALTGAGYFRWHRPPPPTYAETRAGFVRLNADLAPPVDFVALGDSITESVYFGPVCGSWFNAGVGGAKVGDIAAVARYVLPKLKPKIILVAAGTNDFMAGGALPAFERDYLALLATLPRAKVILMGAPNSAAASAFVRSQASARGFRYVEPITGAGLTIADGVHLTNAGARLYRDRVKVACH
jgi:lysophospholipase L1-like esterase